LPKSNEIQNLEAISFGDQKAFSDLFYEFKDHIYTIAFNYTEDPFISEEIVQDVFMRVWKSRTKLLEIESLSSWLYTITKNCSLTALKKIAREEIKKEALISYLPTAINEIEYSIREKFVKSLLDDALTRLSPQQKKIFELSRVKGYDRDEIAEKLHISPATVSVHLTIALRSVRAFLSSRLDFYFLLIVMSFFL